MHRVHDPRRRPGAPDITKIRPTVRSRDDIPAVLIGLQDPCGDEGTRRRLSGSPGRMVLPGKGRRVGRPGMEPLTIPVPGVVRQGLRVRFRQASGPGEPAPDDPSKAEGRATDHGTGTDTNTSVWLTACRSSRRSFPPRPEGRSWRGTTGWWRKSLAPRCAAAVIPSWPGPTSTIRPTAACRWTRRGAWSVTCPVPVTTAYLTAPFPLLHPYSSFRHVRARMALAWVSATLRMRGPRQGFRVPGIGWHLPGLKPAREATGVM